MVRAPRVTQEPRSSVTCIVTLCAWCQARKSSQWVRVWFSSAKYRARHGAKSLNFSTAPAEGDRILLVRTFSHSSFYTALIQYSTASLVELTLDKCRCSDPWNREQHWQSFLINIQARSLLILLGIQTVFELIWTIFMLLFPWWDSGCLFR